MSSTPEKRYGMAVDMSACVGCSACVIACKSENQVPDGNSRRWVNQVVTGSFPNLSMDIWSDSCQHCDDAPCVQNCPTGASYVDMKTGTVQVEAEDCTGCKACMASCPYDARFVHPEGFVDKCTLCVHRLEKGDTTACAAICPTAAIIVGDLNDSESELVQILEKRDNHRQKESAGTEPKFFLLD